MLCLCIDCRQRTPGGDIRHISIHNRGCHYLITEILSPHQLRIRLSVAFCYKTFYRFIVGSGCRVLIDIAVQIILSHRLQGGFHPLGLKHVLHGQRIVAVFNSHRVLNQVHISRRGITAGQIHRNYIRLLFLYQLQPWLQILQAVDLVYRNLIFVNIFFCKYPHRHAANFFFTGNAVGLSLYLCSLPETFVNIFIHLRIFDIIVDLQERAFIGVLKIIIGP